MKEYIHGGDIYRHPDVLDFSANINPLGTPPAVVQAAKDSMEWICHYPDACQEKLKQALAAYEQVPVEWLICGNGAAELIFALVQAVKPKRALVMAPTFAEYAQALEAVGCEVDREILKKRMDLPYSVRFWRNCKKKTCRWYSYAIPTIQRES